jgi:O-antigen ligase
MGDLKQRQTHAPATLLQRAPRPQAESNAPFYLVMFYLSLEFGRPQDIVPRLGALSLPMLTTILIMLLLVTSGKVNFGNMQTKLFVPLLVLMVIHGPIAVNNFHAFNTFKGMALNFVGYLGIITFVDSIHKFRTMAKVWLGIHLYLAVIGVLKGGVGVGGWLGDENDFCMQVNMILSFAFFGLFAESKMFTKSIYFGLLGTYILAIMTTLSRGGFLGMAAVGAYCWAQSSRKLLAAILVFLLVGFMALLGPEKYWSEIESIGSDQTAETGTGGERLYTWEIGWEMFLANPIMGVGQGNFNWVFEDYQGSRTFHGKSIAGRAAHSAYFTLLPELGLIGVSVFVGMLYLTRRDLGLIRRLYRTKARMEPDRVNELKTAYFLSHAIEGSIIGYLVSSIFISTLYYPSFWIMIGFAVALRNVVMRNGTQKLRPV